jgi:hypothetical protein
MHHKDIDWDTHRPDMQNGIVGLDREHPRQNIWDNVDRSI